MAESTEPVEFERGDKVNHPKWGAGTVLYKSGSGDHSKVVVLFQDVGQKTLAVKYAKLEKIAAASQKAKGKQAVVEEVEEIPADTGEAGEAIAAVDDESLELGEEEDEEEEDL